MAYNHILFEMQDVVQSRARYWIECVSCCANVNVILRILYSLWSLKCFLFDGKHIMKLHMCVRKTIIVVTCIRNVRNLLAVKEKIQKVDMGIGGWKKRV